MIVAGRCMMSIMSTLVPNRDELEQSCQTNKALKKWEIMSI